MKVILIHPTGNANVRAALAGLKRANILSVFHTAIATFSGSTLGFLSRFGILKELRRRKFDVELKPLTRMHGLKEFCRILSMKLGLSRLNKQETGVFSVDAVYHHIDRIVASSLAQTNGITAIYAYEDGAFFTFKAARAMGIPCIYDLPTGHWRTLRKLLEEEQKRRPEWASTLTGFKDSIEKLDRKDCELTLASQIIVASGFTASTLSDFPGELAPVTIIPYGFPDVIIERVYTDLNERPLRLLFVGSLSQGKGIANLFEAVEMLGKEVSLTVVGHKRSEECLPLNQALKLHKWFPSLPHDAVLKLMSEHDIFVFPSLFEGFGLVITEAMSQGTPVITTNRTAGRDLIKNGENGWIVEPGSTESLYSCLVNILADKHCIKMLGKAAMETARQRPWDRYSEELSSFIQSNA